MASAKRAMRFFIFCFVIEFAGPHRSHAFCPARLRIKPGAGPRPVLLCAMAGFLRLT